MENFIFVQFQEKPKLLLAIKWKQHIPANFYLFKANNGNDYGLKFQSKVNIVIAQKNINRDVNVDP